MNKAAEQDIDFDATETQDVEGVEKEEETSSEVEVEIVDDTPEEDKGRARRAEGAEPDIPNDEELESYSEGVQKRLKKMKWEFHEERRAKEEAAKLKEEAVSYAQKIKEENDKLKETLEKSEGVLVDQAKGRIDSQIAQAKGKLKEAHEVGDTDALIDAQENGTLEEVFGVGTAATIAQVEKLTFQDNTYNLAPISTREISVKIGQLLLDIKTGNVNDSRGWNMTV